MLYVLNVKTWIELFSMIDSSFEQVWLDILNFAKGKSTIKTLVKKVENDIIDIDNVSITVVSKIKRKGKRSERHLLKSDFQYAWALLEAKKEITLRDIGPELDWKRSIIFTFLATSLLNVDWKKIGSSRMKIFLKNC